MDLKYVFEPTDKIDCCKINALGEYCIALGPGNNDIHYTDEFGGTEPYQTVFLIISNLFILLPAFKSYYLKNYSRTFLNIMAMLISILYHLCKTKSTTSGYCLLHFCVLKNLDYSFSTTLLISIIFFIIPFVDEDGKKTYLSKYNFIESYILLSYFGVLYIILSSTILCYNKNSTLIFIITAGSAIAISIIGNIIVTKCLELNKNYFNTRIIIIGFIIGALSIFLFIISDYLDKNTYWITHSLWHILASITQFILLDIRKKPKKV